MKTEVKINLLKNPSQENSQLYPHWVVLGIAVHTKFERSEYMTRKYLKISNLDTIRSLFSE